MVDIVKVNKYDAGWDASTLFKPFAIRAVMRKTGDAITNINNKDLVERRLRRDVGEDSGEYTIVTRSDGTIEVYFLSSSQLVMWQVQDKAKFVEMFSSIEQHVG